MGTPRRPWLQPQCAEAWCDRPLTAQWTGPGWPAQPRGYEALAQGWGGDGCGVSFLTSSPLSVRRAVAPRCGAELQGGGGAWLLCVPVRASAAHTRAHVWVVGCTHAGRGPCLPPACAWDQVGSGSGRSLPGSLLSPSLPEGAGPGRGLCSQRDPDAAHLPPQSAASATAGKDSPWPSHPGAGVL